MLMSFGLPKLFCDKNSFLINKCPTSALNFEVPDQVWSGHLAPICLSLKTKLFNYYAYFQSHIYRIKYFARKSKIFPTF